MKKTLVIAASCLLALPLALLAQTSVPAAFVGTWKANFAKSKFPGTPPVVDMATVAPDGRVTINETNAKGVSSTWTYMPIDGKAVPVEGRTNVTVIAKKVSDYRTEQTWNMNGRAAKSWAVISKDGKTQTFHMDSVDKDGKPTNEVVVYDKQ
jgi:ABC-type transport system substrate-binding protein